MNYETRVDPARYRRSHRSWTMNAPHEDRRERRKRMWIVLAILVAGALIAALMLARRRRRSRLRAGRQRDRARRHGRRSRRGHDRRARSTPPARLPRAAKCRSARSAKAAAWSRCRSMPATGSAQGQVLAVIDRSVQSQQESGAGSADRGRPGRCRARAGQSRPRTAAGRARLHLQGRCRPPDRHARCRRRARVRWRRPNWANAARATRSSTSSPRQQAWCSKRNVEPGQVVGPGSGALFTIARAARWNCSPSSARPSSRRSSVGADGDGHPGRHATSPSPAQSGRYRR